MAGEAAAGDLHGGEAPEGGGGGEEADAEALEAPEAAVEEEAAVVICGDPACPCRQLAHLEEMERIEREVFPDARPRSEVLVEVEPKEAS